MTSALPSSCVGLGVGSVGQAAILAWTHSIVAEPTFKSEWKASFDALCLSFDLGTLQTRPPLAVERLTSRPALGSNRQVKFNPIVSIALGPDVDWTLHSFDMHDSSLLQWNDKPWSRQRTRSPRSHRLLDDWIFPLHGAQADGSDDARQEAPAGPFLHEAPQSIQNLFQTLMEEDLIEDDELIEPILFRSWYVHHREVPEWHLPRSQELDGHWRFWAATILSAWDDQLRRQEDVVLAVVFPDPPRNDVTRPVLFDILIIQVHSRP